MTFTLAAVGDLVPTRPLGAELRPAVRGVAGLLSAADVAFGDLEIALTDRGCPQEKLITFRARPGLADDVRALGFDVVALANNHSMDYGFDAVAGTMGELDRVGIRHTGAGAGLREAERGCVLRVGDVRVGFLAWSCLLPPGFAAAADRPGIAPIHVSTSFEIDGAGVLEEPGAPPVVRTRVVAGDLERVTARIAEFRGDVDFLAVSVHWGFGFGPALAEYQRPLGHALIDAGADLVLGSHVHGLQGVERYRDKVILYSPGNFIAQQPRAGVSADILRIYDAMSPDGYLAVAEVAPTGSYRMHLHPTMTGPDGLPGLAGPADRERIARELIRLSGPLDTSLTFDGEVVGVGDRTC
ncbi:CapA family protein [Amycolatopsis viridis]|uniref:Poly-gamma-glutamate synthesis protein (Capsule biosynthesis protein) n=1 Tax=Amycolatopsis viridis TaxID=185678 RepID=A0ABX0SSJ8_9PSEU|nr:CapA family protein [Amycolatopsis viridis]NIH78460.1 poly-gamma-glutamate synthesis protein (capsule biosynthesis protein) [Amycolatopsis viridis]